MAELGTIPTPPGRTWRVVAEELSRELRPERMLDLADELIHAFDAEKTATQDSHGGHSH